MSGAPKIVVLGMMTKIPVAGVVWQTLHYLLGLRRLGMAPYYVEAHARSPSMLTPTPESDGAAMAAAYIDGVMRGVDLGANWAYQALHDDGRCYGMSERKLLALYDEAELIVNLHGGTAPRLEHSRTGRLVYLETDPVQLQVELAQGVPETTEFLEQHCAFFTFGENWGAADCGLAPTASFHFHPTRQPVVLDLWPPAERTRRCFTTVGNWRQRWRDVTLDGRVYSWSKDDQFERFLTLPARTGRDFELALSTFDEQDRARLTSHGWAVTDAAAISGDIHRYRAYVSESRGEFTVAKEQNVALRSGWFSDRSATYLAAGRPCVTQETGFSNVLPTGCGLHGFSTLDEAAAAVEAICADEPRAREDARAIAREWFSSDVVLGNLLSACGVATPTRPARSGAGPVEDRHMAAIRGGALADDLPLAVERRRPLRLAAATHERILAAPVPFADGQAEGEQAPAASVVVVTHDNVALTRLCVESVLANSAGQTVELIVVDNASQDSSRTYLRTLARRFAHVALVLNDANRGFAAASNQGLALARGQLLVLLNNDTIVAPGWLERLAAHAADPEIGLVGAVTNRIGNEAEVAVDYETYGGFLQEAARRAREQTGERFELPMPAMFCLALRRDVHARIGALDEGFGLGMLEDDDYAERARRAGYRLVCAEDVLVHHFGEGTLGALFADGSHGELLAANRARFERKWGVTWQPYGRRHPADYERVRERVRQVVADLPAESAVIVASRGDEEILRFPEHRGLHFPQTSEGVYAGHYPIDGAQAVVELERLRAQGGRYFLLPKTSLWWLDHYRELEAHLSERYREVVREEACIMFALEDAR
ncbi:MAG TPA: glycosyltransferase family 2 protein [Conexibacter sp.]|nr:glycosyltransferase family 2 protein [Conexibacter sp.]